MPKMLRRSSNHLKLFTYLCEEFFLGEWKIRTIQNVNNRKRIGAINLMKKIKKKGTNYEI